MLGVRYLFLLLPFFFFEENKPESFSMDRGEEEETGQKKSRGGGFM